MSITDELREFIETHLYLGATALGGWKEGAFAIADRIDAEYEEAIQQALMGDGWMPVTDESIEEHGWVRLPVDADRVPIHFGDVMDGYGKTIEVVELRYGRSGWVLISRDGNGYADTFAFTHHHAPTVEDVLREFAMEVCGEPALTIRSGVVEEYASRLRLAGES